MDWLPWVVIGLIFAAALFLLLREVFTWYWKLSAIDSKLGDIRAELRRINAPAPTTPTAAEDSITTPLVPQRR